MSDDLVKQLLNAPADPLDIENLCIEAADRIEELEAANKRLRLEAAHANDTADAAIERTKELEAALPEQIEWVKRLADDLIAAEAKLINAGSALEMCMDMLEALQEESGRSIEYGEEDAFRMGEWFEAYEFKCLALARTTLAEIKGERHD